MTSLRLRAVDPNWIRIVDLHHKLHRSRSSAQGLKTGEEATATKRMAWVYEATLRDGVVPGIVAECEGVANIGCYNGRVESEFAVTNSDGDVDGEAER